ncbi:MAG: hypothetical protein ACWA6X_10675 [Bauldia sp.]|jgi:hypothetical protein
MVIGTFASLINGKVIVPSSRNDYWAVNKHFLSDLLAPRLGRIHVDQTWYLSRYPDVERAISAGTVADAAEHYRRFGFFEHRMPVPLTVQEDWYLQEYPDVGAAVRERVFTSAQAHFDLVGYAEGRLPYPGFGLNEDDRAAGGGQPAVIPIPRARRAGSTGDVGGQAV